MLDDPAKADKDGEPSYSQVSGLLKDLITQPSQPQLTTQQTLESLTDGIDKLVEDARQNTSSRHANLFSDLE